MCIEVSGFRFGISDLFRISDLEFRIWSARYGSSFADPRLPLNSFRPRFAW